MIYIQWLLNILFILIYTYLSYRFIQVMFKMKHPILFPDTPETQASIRQHPDKPLGKPDFSGQKNGIIIYGGMLLFVLLFFILGLVFHVFTFSFYLVLILPFSYSQDVLNLFAITHDGILSGVRFIPWKSIKSYEFIPIDLQHKYYGFSKEANNGYELKLETKGFPIRCVVTDPDLIPELDVRLSKKINDITVSSHN